MDLLEHKNTNKYVESQEKETNMLNAKIFGLLPFFAHIRYITFKKTLIDRGVSVILMSLSI